MSPYSVGTGWQAPKRFQNESFGICQPVPTLYGDMMVDLFFLVRIFWWIVDNEHVHFEFLEKFWCCNSRCKDVRSKVYLNITRDIGVALIVLSSIQCHSPFGLCSGVIWSKTSWKKIAVFTIINHETTGWGYHSILHWHRETR